jgi:LmeA-like phospholipid-binding
VSEDPTQRTPSWTPRGPDEPTRPQQPPGWPEQPPQYSPQDQYSQQDQYSPQPQYSQQDQYSRSDRNSRQEQPPQHAQLREPRRRRRWPLISGITVLVILILLVVGDRVANAVAENQIADKIQSSGFPAKPSVDIAGFPFLTQVLAHDLHTVHISASNVQEGPLEISSMNATLNGVHLNSGFNGATVDQINGTALITFASLANAGGVPSGVTLSADGPNEIKADVSLAGLFSDTAVAQVTKAGPSQINVRVVDAGGIPQSALGSLANFNVNLPKLPAGLQIQSVSVTQQGVRINVAAHNTTLSELRTP